MAAPPPNIKAVFDRALEIKTPLDREKFLSEACEGDAALRQKVDALLRAYAEAGSFLSTDAAADNDVPAATADYNHAAIRGLVIAGRYSLIEKLGEGGMGEVWVARQEHPVKRKVALKLIRAGRDTKSVLARFEQERQALAVMDHPNIARIFDGGLMETGSPYFVMELVAGVPLTRYCDEARLGIDERLELFATVCQAVQHAHQKGIIHRDLKPANILVTMVDGKAAPKVIDFGVAKAVSGKLTDDTLETQFGSVIGTLEYMAPEQAGLSAADVDTRADIYALGVILYELLTGLRPIDMRRLRHAALDAMIRAIRENEPSKPSTRLSTEESLPSVAAARGIEPRRLAVRLQGDLDWIVMKALEKDRNRRYETASGFAADVRRHLSGEAVQAAPPSSSYRLRKFLRRHRGPVAAAAVVSLTLVAGIVGTTWGLFEARRQWGLAESAREGESRHRGIAEAVLEETTDDVMKNLIGSREKLGKSERAFLERSLQRWERHASASADEDAANLTRAMGLFRVANLRHRLGDMNGAEADFRRFMASQEELVAKHPESPQFRQGLASAHEALGEIAIHTGRKKEGETHHRTALALATALAAEHPDNAEYRKAVGANHLSLSYMTEGSEQVSHLESALEVATKLVAEFPGHREHGEYRYLAAQAQGRLADALRAPDRKEEAVKRWRDAISQYEKLAADYPDASLHRTALASALNAEAIWLRDYGEWNAAEDRHLKAVAVCAKLAADFPAVPDHRYRLAINYNDYANFLLITGKADEAEHQYRTAATIHARLAAEFPAEPAYRRVLAGSRANFGACLVRRRQFVGAEREYRGAVELLSRIVQEDPDPTRRSMLANCLADLGNVLMESGRAAEGEREHRSGLAIAEQLQREQPNELEWGCNVARIQRSLSDALWRQGKHQTGVETNRKAIDLYEALVAKNPSAVEPRLGLAGTIASLAGKFQEIGAPPPVRRELADRIISILEPFLVSLPTHPDAQRDLSIASHIRAVCFRLEGKFSEAIPDWDRAVQYSPPHQRAMNLAGRASSLVRAGRDADAMADVDVAEKRPEADAGTLYNCACVTALASQKDAGKKEELAKRSVALLRRAITLDGKQQKAAAKDSDFDSLRGREDFRKLVADSEMKSQAPKSSKE